jgi:hypothetical protein
MNYLDFDKLAAIGTDFFWQQQPFPWLSERGLLTDEGYKALLDNMPPLDLFDEIFGAERRAGQNPHDRYSLEYVPGMPVPQPWQEFIEELRSDAYRDQIKRLFKVNKLDLRFHWHYTPTGCSVSPHCDARREFGSHLFYFNSEEDWDPAWGGDTLIMDDGGRLSYDSAPPLEEFDHIYHSKSQGNHSAIIKRTDHAWHAVETINCPEEQMRRIFIVVTHPNTLFWKIRDRLIGKKIQRL